MKCKNCNITIHNEDVVVDRDGDPYSPDTNFWDICPHCLEKLEEDKNGEDN